MKNEIAELEDDFLHGRIESLKQRRCPLCDGHLFYDVVKSDSFLHSAKGQRFRCGISIFCGGDCKKMLSHMDGLCPAWAEGISDWNKFSQDLYRDRS